LIASIAGGLPFGPARRACAVALSLRTSWRTVFSRSELIARRAIARRSFPARFIARRRAVRISRAATQLCREAPPLLVARNVEARPRITMLASRPPVGLAALGAAAAFRSLRLFRARPQTAAREPHHHRVGVLVVELRERRLELFAQLRAKRRRFPFDDDRPVCEAWGHARLL
jgi:hypothetical protein